MRMNKATPPFVLNYEPHNSWVRRPRLWRLTIGLLIAVSAAAAIPWIAKWPSGWVAMPDADIRLSLGVLGVVGIAMALHAVARDSFHVELARFSADGLHIRWSQVPRLWGTRLEKEQQLVWSDVVHLEWREGSLEHDLKQYVVVHLRTPLAPGKNRVKLLVCDDRNVGQCEALIANLPTSVLAPRWLATTRLRRQHYTA